MEATTTAAERGPALDSAARPPLEPWEINCLNCSAALSGPFCSRCGQRAVPPHPSLPELSAEAFAELSGFDGKIAATLRLLVTRPGKLTLEFLEGKRAQYISPLRLYLWCSVLYFVLSAAAPSTRTLDVSISSGPGAKPTNIAGAANNQLLTDEDRAEIQEKLNTAPVIMKPLLRRVMTDPAGLQRDIFEAMPKALFVLLPVFAGILWLFYRKRNFGEHLYFALHLHAFTFAVLTLSVLAKLTKSAPIGIAVGLVVLVWLPVYTHRALRRVYGGSQAATLLKELGIGWLYAAASVPALVGLAMWVAWRAS